MENREKGTGLAIAEGGLPDIEQAKTILEQFRGIKRELLTSSEFYEIPTDNGRKELLNRQGCSVLSLIFQLSEPEPPEVAVMDLPDGELLFRVRTCIEAPNGRRSWGVGSCSTAEIKKKGPRAYHDAEAKAHTRAKERAISDLVGGGDLTAEEIGPGEFRKPHRKANGRAGKLNFVEEFIGMLDLPRATILAKIEARFGTKSLSKLTDQQLGELVDLIERSENDADFLQKVKNEE